MHDLDRILAEVDAGELEPGEGDFSGEAELLEHEDGAGSLDEMLHDEDSYGEDGYEVGDDVDPETDLLELAADEDESDDAPLSEVDEMDLATQLLEVATDEELDQFLGKVFKRAWRGVRGAVRGVAKPLGKTLKAVAKRALPMLGGVVGTAFGGPLGASLGSRLAGGAGRMFGLETEGLSPEDRDYEVARRFVRFASSAATSAARGNPATPRATVQRAVRNAAQRFAPGLVQAPGPGAAHAATPQRRVRRGTWIRRGRAIILIGA